MISTCGSGRTGARVTDWGGRWNGRDDVVVVSRRIGGGGGGGGGGAVFVAETEGLDASGYLQ